MSTTQIPLDLRALTAKYIQQWRRGHHCQGRWAFQYTHMDDLQIVTDGRVIIMVRTFAQSYYQPMWFCR